MDQAVASDWAATLKQVSPKPGLLLILLWLPAMSMAEDTPALCGNAGTTVAMTQCLEQIYRQRQQALENALAELQQQLPGFRQPWLLASQQAWEQFRDSEARFAASGAEGGSFSRVLYSLALIRLTEQRTGQVQRAAEPEND